MGNQKLAPVNPVAEDELTDRLEIEVRPHPGTKLETKT